MAVRTLVTAGFGNGTFSGTIPLVVTRGYAISVLAAKQAGVAGELAIYHSGLVAGVRYTAGAMKQVSYKPGSKQ